MVRDIQYLDLLFDSHVKYQNTFFILHYVVCSIEVQPSSERVAPASRGYKNCNLKSITLYQKVPQIVTNMVFSMFSNAILIWLYLENPSIKENRECHTMLSTSVLIYNKGKLSFGISQFKSL